MRARDARRTSAFASIVAGVLAVSLLAPAPALAQPSKDAVLFLYNEGKELMEAGKYAEACARFEKAQHLDPTAINLLLRLGDCYEKLGRTATAWEQLKRAARVAADAKDAREAAANDRVRAIEPKLSRLVLHLPPLSDARGLEVRLNGAVVARADFGKDSPVDPGSYTIEATAPGRRRWSVTQEVAANGARVDVTVPALESLGDADSGPVAPPSSSDDRGLGARRIIGITAGVMGLVGIGVGAAFGLKALSKNNASNKGHCDADSFCDDAGYALREDAQQAGTISTIAFVAGAAFAAGGVVLVLTAPSKRPAPAASTRVQAFASASPGGFATGVAGSF